MAGIFNKAYDQADRMLNGSGLSSIVYRQGGGRYSNRDEEFSDVEGYRPYRSKFRRGLQSLPSTAKMFINALTGKEDITDENVSKYFPKEELSVIAELPDKQEKLISEGAIRPSLGQKGNRRGQILDRGPEAELLNYSERQTDKLLRPDIFEKYGYGEEGQKKYEEWWDKRTPILSPLMDLLQAPPRYNVANTLRKFYYGEPNLAGQRRIMDEYNYHYGKPTGSIQEALQFLTDPWEQKSPDAIKWLIETIGSRAEESGDDRKVKIDITAPPPYKDGGWNFNPQTGEYIYDQGQYHPEAIDVEGYSYDPQTNVSSIDDMAIDTTSGLKHGGQTMPRGLSGLNDSININGQPHRLVWANPQEERVLKDMGGSGKEVLGKPAYFDEHSWGESDIFDTTSTGGGGDPQAGVAWASEIQDYDIDPSDYYPVPKPDTSISTEQPSSSEATQVDIGLPWLADKNIPAATRSYNLVGDLPRKGFLGLTGDRMNMSQAYEGAYKLGFTKWREGIGMYETDAPKAYNEWFAKQNPQDLVEGYKYGDPVGHSTRSSMNRVSEQLKNKFTAARDLASVGQEDEEPYEMTRKDYQEAAKDIEDIEDFTPFDGNLPAWMPAWMKAGAGFFSRTVIGTGKVGGVGVHIHEDGTITAVSPEDSPGYDHAAQHEPGGEVARRYRSKPVEQASISETVEKEPSALERLLASRPEPSSLAQLDEKMKARLIKDFYGGRDIFSEVV